MEDKIREDAKKHTKEKIAYYESDDHWHKFYDSYIAGAHSRDEEIDSLKQQLKEATEMDKYGS